MVLPTIKEVPVVPVEVADDDSFSIVVVDVVMVPELMREIARSWTSPLDGFVFSAGAMADDDTILSECLMGSSTQPTRHARTQAVIGAIFDRRLRMLHLTCQLTTKRVL